MEPKFCRSVIALFAMHAFASFIACCLPWQSLCGQESERGAAIYSQQCASCHGPHGQGVSGHYENSLTGDLSVPELAKVIQETMPETAPKSLSIEDSQAIAAYIHNEFYSPYAQLRNAPPKRALSHLTADQFRRSVMDLMVSSVGRAQAWKGDGGLQRTVNQGDWSKDRKEVEKKIESKLTWDWGDGKPVPEIDKEKWQIQWSGSILAPATGVYEFSLDATIHAKLFVNNDKVPLIDAGVVSYEKSLNTASIFLIAGHPYRFVLDASRSKEPKARVSLEWKPPGGAREAIPEEFLSSQWSPIALIPSTSFPPDDASVGYERGTNLSREWLDATVGAAIEVGNTLTSDLKRWMPKNGNDPGNIDQVKQWCYGWVATALRRSLSDDDKQHYVDSQFAGDVPIEQGVKRVCILTLTSPDFQYPGITGSPDENNVARLALVLWDSLPDPWMMELAAKGQSHAPEQLKPIVSRMLKDPRFVNKLHRFYVEWLGLHQAKDLTKSSARFADFSLEVQSDLRRSIDLFLDAYTDCEADVRGLFTSRTLFVNERLASLYGVAIEPPPADGAPVEPKGGFRKIERVAEQSAGVLTHPLVQANYAYHDSSSPIHRGVFLARRILGRNLRPPVDAIIPITEEAEPGLTTRERVAKQTSGAMCQSCHRVINPLGFVFENFDAIGRFRSEELGKPIDVVGSYTTSEGKVLELKSLPEFSQFLAESPEVHQSLVRQLFQFFAKQPLPAYGVDQPKNLTEILRNGGYKLQPVLEEIGALVCKPEQNQEVATK